MRKAALDIGTNTTRLLVADYDGADRFTPVVRREKITRLGGGFTATAGIADHAMKRTLTVLEEYKNIMNQLRVDSTVAVATSVVRDAGNRETFVKKVRKSTGIDIVIISGEVEAILATRGALLPIKSPFDHALIFDIGGGSTEFIFTTHTSPLYIESTDLGVVHLTEQALRHDPPGTDELAAIQEAVDARLTLVRKHLEKKGLFPFSPHKQVILVGIAGTPTTIAAIDLEMNDYDRERITNHTLSPERIEKIYHRLIALPAAERLMVPGLQEGREDLIIPGILITLEIIRSFKVEPLRVIDSGILEGIILSDHPDSLAV